MNIFGIHLKKVNILYFFCFLQAANAGEDLEFLSSTAIHNPSTRMSPFNMTGGFDDGASDLDTLEDDPMMGT